MIVIGATGFYVLIGGFRGVVLTDFLQTLLLFAISFIVGWICFKQYTAEQLHEALQHGGVTVDYWKSLAFEAHPNLGVFSKSKEYSGWSDFAGAAIALSLVGMIGCVGGIDVNLLCQEKSEDIKSKVIEDGQRFRRSAGGYALGSGNSIPDYVPVDGYMAMVEAVRHIRENERN